jgi:hypothetical protein
MDKDIRAVQAATRQVLGRVRVELIAEAQEIADRAGSEAILVSRLADKFGVASLTAKRWLLAAGFKLNVTLKGRPSFEAVLVHDGLLDVLKGIKARKSDEG